MTDDDRVQLSSECGKEVHNFAALTSDEAASLLATGGDDLCGRLTRTRDRSLVTAMPAEPSHSLKGGVLFRIRTLMAIIAGIARFLRFGGFIDWGEVTYEVSLRLACNNRIRSAKIRRSPCSINPQQLESVHSTPVRRSRPLGGKPIRPCNTSKFDVSCRS